MEQSEIIRMARERANAILFDLIGNPDWDKPCTEEHLFNFANELLAKRKIENDKAAAIGISIAVLAERDACAKVCETDELCCKCGDECAEAIRARGE